VRFQSSVDVPKAAQRSSILLSVREDDDQFAGYDSGVVGMLFTTCGT